MTQEAFNVLDQHYGLVPEQEVQGNGRTYVWVCNYAGGRFFTEVSEDWLWLPDGI